MACLRTARAKLRQEAGTDGTKADGWAARRCGGRRLPRSSPKHYRRTKRMKCAKKHTRQRPALTSTFFAAFDCATARFSGRLRRASAQRHAKIACCWPQVDSRAVRFKFPTKPVASRRQRTPRRSCRAPGAAGRRPQHARRQPAATLRECPSSSVFLTEDADTAPALKTPPPAKDIRCFSKIEMPRRTARLVAPRAKARWRCPCRARWGRHSRGAAAPGEVASPARRRHAADESSCGGRPLAGGTLLVAGG